MILTNVYDTKFKSRSAEPYDLAIFACGYEERCTFIAEQTNREFYLRALLFGFEEHLKSEQRSENREKLEGVLGEREILTSANDGRKIYQALASCWPQDELDGKPIKILIDYSSMSRIWYSTIVNFVRFQRRKRAVTLDFVYTIGEHQDYEMKENDRSFPDIVVQDVMSVPGFEGLSLRHFRTIAGLGLGFEWEKSWAVFELLEPDRVFVFFADPGAFKEYPEIARRLNREFIHEHVYSSDFISIPLRSVEIAYKRIGERVVEEIGQSNIALVPMGPKPHVLASLLICCRFPQISLLHAVTKRPIPERVRAAGGEDSTVLTSVEFVPSL